MHRKLFIAESVLILLPVTLVSLAGGVYILALMIGEKLSYIPIFATFFSLFIMLSLLGLLALWVEVIGYIKFRKSILLGRKLGFFLHIGAGIALLSILSFISLILYPQSKDSTGAIGFLIVASPALITYGHALYVHKNS